MALTEIPIELSSTPGIVDNSNATAITIDASENVGIGVSNPSDYYATNLVVTGPSEGGITIASTGNHTNYLLFADSTSGVARYAGMIEYAHSLDQMAFRTNSIQRMAIDSSGNVTITDGNLVVAANHGIDFSANSSAAGMSSELFEHYEEGTWTPVPVGLETSGGTYAGFYTKTGRVVNWGAYILLPATSDTSSILVSGLPYATLGGAGTTSNTAIGYQNTTTRLQALPNPGTALLYFYTDVASATQPTYSSASGKSIYVGGSYFTA